MDIETLKCQRDRAKLEWWYILGKLHSCQRGGLQSSSLVKVKPHRGRQKKSWSSIKKQMKLGLYKPPIKNIESSWG